MENNKGQERAQQTGESRVAFEKAYPCPAWAIEANGPAGKFIYYNDHVREWNGFQKGWQARVELRDSEASPSQPEWDECVGAGTELHGEAEAPRQPFQTYLQGRLDQYIRMKNVRPADPVYWDSHEERDLKEAVRREAEGNSHG